MSKKRAFLYLILLLCFSLSSHAQIKWVSLQEAYTLTQTNPKKIIIDVYTDWCGWCKVMDKKTFTNPEVVKFINDNYYAVKLDAETKETIKIGGVEYKYNQESRANDVAIALLQGKMSFPSIVYLDEKFNMIQPIPGYMEARQFHEVITFLGKDFYKKEAFDLYKNGTYLEVYKDKLASL